jgi:hypothetical protein
LGELCPSDSAFALCLEQDLRHFDFFHALVSVVLGSAVERELEWRTQQNPRGLSLYSVIAFPVVSAAQDRATFAASCGPT